MLRPRCLALLFAVLLAGVLTSCGGDKPPSVPTATPTQVPTATQTPTPTPEPYLGPFIPLGEPVHRDLGTSTERIRNCVEDGEEPIIKTPSSSVATSYNVQWSVGGKTGGGFKIGGGVLPIEVNLEASLAATYGNEVTQLTTRGTGWQLPAKPNTIVTYILSWGETWQPGYVEFRVLGQSAMPIDVMYRLDVTSEIVAEDAQFCDGTPIAGPIAPSPVAGMAESSLTSPTPIPFAPPSTATPTRTPVVPTPTPTPLPTDTPTPPPPTATPTPPPTDTPTPTPTPTLVPPTYTPTPVPPTATLMTLSQPTGKYPCPLIVPRAQVNRWRIGQASIQAVDEAIGQFNSLRPHNEGAFNRGTTIPVGVLVATNYDEQDGTKWEQYPVRPIVHSGSWGLFETIGEYEAPNAGACITISN